MKSFNKILLGIAISAVLRFVYISFSSFSLVHAQYDKTFITQFDLLSHERMKIWLKDHPFKFAFPRALNRFFIEKLVK